MPSFLEAASGPLPPTGYIGQIPNDFRWVGWLEVDRGYEGRPAVWETHYVCENLSGFFHFSLPATDDCAALGPNTITYAHPARIVKTAFSHCQCPPECTVYGIPTPTDHLCPLSHPHTDHVDTWPTTADTNLPLPPTADKIWLEWRRYGTGKPWLKYRSLSLICIRCKFQFLYLSICTVAVIIHLYNSRQLKLNDSSLSNRIVGIGLLCH